MRWLQTRLKYSAEHHVAVTGAQVELATRVDGGWMLETHAAGMGVEAVTFEAREPRHFAWTVGDADTSDVVVLFDGADATVCRPGLDCPGADGDATATVPPRP